ncbi:hypothetical protein GCM10029963_02980 [Micromonospora andamanensis]
MTDTLLIGLYALAAGGVVGLVGAAALRLLRGRSILVHILVLLAVTVLAVVAGVVTVAQAMFLSAHDLWVVLVTVSAAALISLAVGAVFGSRLAASAVWAQTARERERRLEAGRRELVAWVSHDLRTPWRGCGPWPRPWRTASSRTRPSSTTTTGGSGWRPTGWPSSSTTCSSCPASTPGRSG